MATQPPDRFDELIRRLQSLEHEAWKLYDHARTPESRAYCKGAAQAYANAIEIARTEAEIITIRE